MKSKIPSAKEFFDNLSREDFFELMLDAGFDIRDGDGTVIITDSLEKRVSFDVQASFRSRQPIKYIRKTEVFPFPFAS